MNLSTLIAGSATFLTYLAVSAVRTLALALITGLILRCLRPNSIAIRFYIWTAVLYAGFAIPLLGSLAHPLPVPTPALLQRPSEPAEIPNVQNPAEQRFVYGSKLADQGSIFPAVALAAHTDHQQQALPHSNFAISWPAVASVIYFGVVILLFLRFAIGLSLARRLVLRAQRINESAVKERISSRALKNGLDVVPEARESEVISTPLAIGTLRSTILLPADWQDWEEEKLDAVIAHEMSHIRRRDGLTQCVSLVHRAVFWFSPLSWWLTRHLANLAEQASDEAALSDGADRYQYAKTLLGFFELANATSGRVWWQGVAMGNAGQAEKRMERILAWRGTVAMNFKKSAAVMMVAFAILLLYVVAAANPVNSKRAGQEPPPPNAAVPASPSTSSDVPAPAMPATREEGTYNSGPPPVAPADPEVPPEPALPAAPGQHEKMASGSGHNFHYAYGFDDEERFVIVSGNSDSLTMSGSSQDARHVEKLRKQITGDFIWFQRDEKSYVIRDQATIDRARQLWVPQKELGKKQAELGKKQAELGKQQAELGAKMRQVQVKVPDLTAELDRLRAELKQLSSGATAEQVGKLQAEMGELQAKIGSVQAEGGEQQARIGAQMGELGEKQGALGKEQGELGRQQADLARHASEQMKQLLDEAMKKGLAQPEPEMHESSTL